MIQNPLQTLRINYGGKKLAEEQLLALDKMEDFLENKEEFVMVLQGYAGTGKTTILNEYIQYLDSLEYNFVLCAPTHKAKLVMEEITGYEAITVHKLLSLAPNIEIFNLDYTDLKFYSGGNDEIPTKGIVIIDEASMINDEIYKLLEEYCKKAHSKLLFIGDIAQLQPVNNNATSRVFECPNKITLTKIHRQANTNGLLPLLAKLREQPLKRFKSIEAPEGSLIVYDNTKEFMIKASEAFKKAIRNQDIMEVKLAAYTNDRVKGLNKCMRRLLWDKEEPYHKFEFLTGYENFEYNKNQFYNSLDYIITNSPHKIDRYIPHFMKLPGYELELYDKVYKKLLQVFIIDNDINKDYLNSLSSLIEDIRISAIEAKRYGYRMKSSSLWKKYFEIMKSFATPTNLMFDNRVIKKKTFDYGYASSTHKLQGTSINTIFIDMANIMLCRNKDELRQLQYVSLSRTKSDAHILV